MSWWFSDGHGYGMVKQSTIMSHDVKHRASVLVISNGIIETNQQLCRDPCVLSECVFPSGSAVIRAPVLITTLR